MAKLRLDHAPQATSPRRFLLSAPVWGVAGGALLVAHGASLLDSRWNTATLALVHIFTLGVLGNIMLGSILQFLPAAAQARVRSGRVAASVLHALFNLGAAALVAGLYLQWPLALDFAAVVLPAPFILLAGMTLPGLPAAMGPPLLRWGLGVAIACGCGAALLGAALAYGLVHRPPWPLPALTDVHAAWASVGWVLVLIASVARVVMPMFQGTGSTPPRLHAAWLVSVGATLALATSFRLGGQTSALRAVVAAHALFLAATVVWFQWRARKPRRGPLFRSWRTGALLIAATAMLLATGAPRAWLAAGYALVVALPMLLLGMAQEIVAFIAWIALQRRCGRGVHLPGVQMLMPDRDKARVLAAQLPAALLLGAAVAWPSAGLARPGGLALALAWGFVAWSLDGARRRANRYAFGAPRA